MSVKSITVTGEQLILQLSEPFDGELFVREQVAVVGPLAGRELSMVKVACNDGKLALPRFVGAHDRIYSQFTVWLPSHEKMDGVKYVTDFAEDVADWSYAYPQPSTKKTLGATPEDIRLLGIKQTHTNINLPQIMTPFEAEGTIPYVCDGKTYYFIGEEIEALDRWMQERWEAGALVTGILLNIRILPGRPRIARMAPRPLSAPLTWKRKKGRATTRRLLSSWQNAIRVRMPNMGVCAALLFPTR